MSTAADNAEVLHRLNSYKSEDFKHIGNSKQWISNFQTISKINMFLIGAEASSDSSQCETIIQMMDENGAVFIYLFYRYLMIKNYFLSKISEIGSEKPLKDPFSKF